MMNSVFFLNKYKSKSYENLLQLDFKYQKGLWEFVTYYIAGLKIYLLVLLNDLLIQRVIYH